MLGRNVPVLVVLVSSLLTTLTAPAAALATCAPDDPSTAAGCIAGSAACEVRAMQGAGCTGPYGGFVAQAMTARHTFASPPPQIFCFLPVAWIVTLRYDPPADALELLAGGRSAVGVDGVAVVRFVGECWTRFDIAVRGADVAILAGYTVAVDQGPAF